MDNNWWLRENIEWSNIGVDVVSRPTEIEALNNISQQAKYLRQTGNNYDYMKLTELEKKLYELELLVTSENFDTNNYPLVRKKDSTVRRISKISGYSEPFVMRKLTTITRKIWLSEVFCVDVFEEKDTNYQKLRRYKLTKKWLEYKRKYKRVM